jgi:hypothetical protein
MSRLAMMRSLVSDLGRGMNLDVVVSNTATEGGANWQGKGVVGAPVFKEHLPSLQTPSDQNLGPALSRLIRNLGQSWVRRLLALHHG